MRSTSLYHLTFYPWTSISYSLNYKISIFNGPFSYFCFFISSQEEVSIFALILTFYCAMLKLDRSRNQ
jgi:hypothetical protein